MARPRPVAFVKAHPFAADLALALLVLGIALPGLWFSSDQVDVDFRDPDALGVALVVLATLPVAWRRQAPLPVLVATWTGGVALEVLGYSSGGGALGIIVALYTVAAHSERRDALAAAALTAVGIAVVLVTSRFEPEPVDVIANYVVFATAWVLGDNVRTRRGNIAGLEERAHALEREQEEAARRAVTAERTRIARELHDVVAHSVSVMVVQAGAARRVLEREPEQARAALQTVESVGRESLTELRRLLGVLRREGDARSERVPQPSVEHLDALLGSTREAGLPVVLDVEGDPRPLPPGVDMSAYRIVQEALTNAIKHAGPATATVRIRYGAEAVDVEISDDGRGAAANGGYGSGHGLVGMRERIAMCGGVLSAGPRPGGGFLVKASLPLEEAGRS